MYNNNTLSRCFCAPAAKGSGGAKMISYRVRLLCLEDGSGDEIGDSLLLIEDSF